jgi:D-amino-acid dehydrogenase
MARIGIVGGGIIGSAAGAWLMAEGHAVTLFERDPEGKPASGGNAGLLALPEITPLARPSVLASVPRWLMDPLGPLALRWQDVPALTPWLARFLAAARPHRVALGTSALAFLMKTALADHQELARRAGLSGHMQKTGALHVFDADRGFRSALVEWNERRRYGVEYREMSVAEARALVPALQGPFHRAVFAPDYWTVSSPSAILAALRRRIASSAKIVAVDVIGILPEAEGVAIVTADGAELPFDRVVLAGGVWSRDLVRKLGLRVALETERGYNTTYPRPPLELAVPVFFAEHGFVATQLADGLRIGGAVELAAPDAPPNFARAAAMRATMRRYVPDLPEEGGVEWMGRRPSTPDSLPVIGAHPSDPRIVLAFGHGHLGLTLSAVTARQIAGLIAGRAPDAPLRAFGIERFQ